ncbi:unnamed protein product [Cunninghamella echinulata]
MSSISYQQFVDYLKKYKPKESFMDGVFTENDDDFSRYIIVVSDGYSSFKYGELVSTWSILSSKLNKKLFSQFVEKSENPIYRAVELPKVYRTCLHGYQIQYLTNDNLRRHEIAVYGIEHFKFQTCNQSFTKQYNKNKHDASYHLETNPIPCKNKGCNIRCKDKSTATRHYNIAYGSIIETVIKIGLEEAEKDWIFSKNRFVIVSFFF